MRIKTDAIILDIDGTLWNTTPVVAKAWNVAIEKSALPAKKISGSDLKSEFGKPMDKIAQSLWPNLSLSQQAILMKECCVQEQIALCENQTPLDYPNVVCTIKKMSEQFSFYIVSNCQSGYIELAAKKLDISQFVRDSECYGDTKKYKAENLRLLCERNALKAPLYALDTQGDVEACKEAGVPFVWASYGFGKADFFEAKLEDFKDLPDLVEPLKPYSEASFKTPPNFFK